MRSRFHLKTAVWAVFLAAINGCVERIYFDAPFPQNQIVVEGTIRTDEESTKVKISKGFSFEGDTTNFEPVTGFKLTLFDDRGLSETFEESSAGIYITKGLIRGEVGRSYYIRLASPDGSVYESLPDKLNPVGEIDSIRHEFEARTTVKAFGEIKSDVFKISVDGTAGATYNNETYVRWRFKGTYKVITYPSKNITFIPGYAPFQDPFPCSGYAITLGPQGSGGVLEKRGDCTCCECWPNQFEIAPQLSGTQLIVDGRFNNIKVSEVPINSSTFYEKYLVEIEQMSLSRRAFDFFKLVREQKVNASSLFQSPSGEIIGNIRSNNSRQQVIGLFWATSVSKKSKFLYPEDVPYKLTPIEFNTKPCYVTYKNAQTIKPSNW